MQFLLSGGHCQIIFGNPPEPRNVCIGGNYTYRSLRALWWIRASTLRRFGHGLFAERQDRWGSTVYLRKVAFCRFDQTRSYPKLLKMSMHITPKKGKNKTQLKSRRQRTSTKHKLQAITQSHTIESNPRVKRNTTKCKCKMQNETPIQKMHTKDANKKQ